jgi:hypothetical protein
VNYALEALSMFEDIESAIAKMADARIREAIDKGEFDGLPGRGKPLKIDDLSLVPEDLRAGYILLKNSGFLPEELELHKEITSLTRLLDSCTRDEEKYDLRGKLQLRTMRYNMLLERRRRPKKPPLLR